MQEFTELPVELLEPAPDNPRRDAGDVDDLAASIQAVGLLEPLIVTVNEGGTYVVVCGHRRLAAAKAVGLAKVPCLVRTLEDAERLEFMLVENLQRQDLAPLEEAAGFARLRELGHSQRAIAERVGCHQSHVSRRLGFLELPERAQEALYAGSITVEDAVELTKLRDHPERLERALEVGERSFDGIAGQTRREVSDLQREKKLAELRAELEAEGVRILGDDDDPGVFLEAGWGLDIDADDHAGEPCHAAQIVAWRGEVQYVCTDPERHDPDGESELKGPERGAFGTPAEPSEQAKAREALREAADRRRAFAAELVQNARKRKIGKDEVLELAARALLQQCEQYLDGVMGLLGLEQGDTPEDDRALVVEFASSGKTPMWDRVALAAALDSAGDMIGHFGWVNWHEERWYLDFLVAHGYELTDAEQERLEADAAAAAEAQAEADAGDEEGAE